VAVNAEPDARELARANENLREQQRAISDVLRAVASSSGLQPVVDEILRAAIRLCRGDHGQLYLLHGDLLHIFSAIDREHDAARLAEAYEYGKAHPHALDRTTVVGRAALLGEPVQIHDVLADPEYAYGGQQIVGYRALLGVPIVLDGELIGAVAIGRDVPRPFGDDEVELVKTFADQAAIAIANTRLLEAVERQRTELSRFLSPQVAELISSPEGERLLAGHRAYITCLFCDLRGFTAFAETAAPEELFDVLRGYHETLGALIPAYGGTLEHFAGDGVMVFLNDPVPVEQHELEAIRLALAAQERVGKLAEAWRKRGIQLGLGIGIEAGYATLGRIGFEGRYDYGAFGPVTNLASRLSGHAEAGQTLIGQRVFGAVDEVIDAAPVGELELKGFGRPVSAYEVRTLRRS
jgi:adenylate cyclase